MSFVHTHPPAGKANRWAEKWRLNTWLVRLIHSRRYPNGSAIVSE